jgi:hypothetical protein
MKSWGKLPEQLIPEWKAHHCDAYFTRNRLRKKTITDCSVIPNHFTNNSLPLIAIMAATTTRGLQHKASTKNLALFLYLLPSLVRSIDCGFRYQYYLGYDVGDPFYDSEKGLKEVTEWFEKNVEKPLKEKSVSLSLQLVKVKNTVKKPGPVFIEMARAAHSNGASYFYRVNDDTEFIHNWPTIYVRTLLSLQVPYGVIGPLCNHGNERILTHDFVHRLHMEIFEGNYYPPELSDWWMDDWISYVYGQRRTFMSRHIKVVHHTGHQGTRYQVDHAHESLLPNLIKQGTQKIRTYMLKKGVDEAVLKTFDKDTFNIGFKHRDIPMALQEI